MRGEYKQFCINTQNILFKIIITIRREIFTFLHSIIESSPQIIQNKQGYLADVYQTYHDCQAKILVNHSLCKVCLSYNTRSYFHTTFSASYRLLPPSNLEFKFLISSRIVWKAPHRFHSKQPSLAGFAFIILPAGQHLMSHMQTVFICLLLWLSFQTHKDGITNSSVLFISCEAYYFSCPLKPPSGISLYSIIIRSNRWARHHLLGHHSWLKRLFFTQSLPPWWLTTVGRRMYVQDH